MTEIEKIEHKIQLNFGSSDVKRTVVKQNSDKTHVLLITLYDNDDSLTIDTTWNIVISARKPDGKFIVDSNNISVINNVINVVLTKQMLATPGTEKCELSIYKPDGSCFFSDTFFLYVEPNVNYGSQLESTNEYDSIVDTLNKIKDYEEDSERTKDHIHDVSDEVDQLKVDIEDTYDDLKEAVVTTNHLIEKNEIIESNEKKRGEAEEKREQQEGKRQYDTASAITNAEKATKKANDAADDLQDKLDTHHFVLTEDKDVAGGVAGYDIVIELQTRLNALADSDDTTLDQLSEIVAYIKNNKALIDSITTSKVNVSNIIDNLTSTAVNKPLSAKQGKVLKDLIDSISITANSKVSGVKGNAETSYRTGNVNLTPSNIGAAYGLSDLSINKVYQGTYSDKTFKSLTPNPVLNTDVILKVIRNNITNDTEIPWLLGGYSAGIAFGGSDTRGALSMRYDTPKVRFAGGNTTSDWHFDIKGKRDAVYDLEALPIDNVDGLKAKLDTKKDKLINRNNTGSGSAGYLAIAKINIVGYYVNAPVEFTIIGRGRMTPCTITVLFTNASTPSATDVSRVFYSGSDMGVFIHKVKEQEFILYATKIESYDNVYTMDIKNPYENDGGVVVTPVNNYISTKPTSGVTNAALAYGYNTGYAYKAGRISDSGNGGDITFAYSKAGLETANWLAAWNGAELRAISPQKLADTVINALPETTANPVDNSFIVVQSTEGKNEYGKKKLSSLWNWIKSKLSTVATTGSYNDLSDKPGTATSSTSGLVKLYTSTGTKTDGTMTQNAIKTALDGKASTGHTHGGLVQSWIDKVNGTISLKNLILTKGNGVYILNCVPNDTFYIESLFFLIYIPGMTTVSRFGPFAAANRSGSNYGVSMNNELVLTVSAGNVYNFDVYLYKVA